MTGKNVGHMIVDFMHIYYKYKFLAESGRIKRLTSTTPQGVEDVTLIYYVIKDIEALRKGLEAKYGPSGAMIALTICMDNKPSVRLEETGSEQYKKNRKHSLTEEDHRNIEVIAEMLRIAGYKVLSIPGYEADDLIAFLVLTGHSTDTTPPNGKDLFGASFIYTNDSDMLAYVLPNKSHVFVRRQKEGYIEATHQNFTEVTGRLIGHELPFNTVMLYKSLVGDKSDNIPGVKGFGDAAFDKLIANREEWLWNGGFDVKFFNYPMTLQRWFEECAWTYLEDWQIEQAMQSFELVRPRGSAELAKTIRLSDVAGISTEDRRKSAYLDTYGFKSLV